MTAVRNVLFVMCDQLRRDFVSCYGESRVETPNIDRRAARGVRFDNAFVQAGVCGPARMSYYTGRYVNSHGATWNRVPLSASEWTLGDYLRAAGRTAALAGKTHVLPDTAALKHFGIEIESERGALLREGGFLVVDRYDGHMPPGPESGYAEFLRSRAMTVPIRGPISSSAPSTAITSYRDGTCAASTCLLASRSAAETAYIRRIWRSTWMAAGVTPWVPSVLCETALAVSRAGAFHKLFRRRDIGPIRHGPQDGTADEHPVARAYREHDECKTFAREDVVRHVRPAYMGLIAQIDFHLGRVLDTLEAMGRMRDTLIVFTSDHGEFSGDRGLGEKELLYDEIVRVPMIVMDPDPRADPTRGKPETRFVEGIDVLPTIVEALGIAGSPHRVEGRSLLPLLRGDANLAWRDAVFAELDYGFRRARQVLGPRRARLSCLHGAYRRVEVRALGRISGAALRSADPLEQCDLGADGVRGHSLPDARALYSIGSPPASTATVDDAQVETRTDTHRAHGIHIGIW